MEDLQRERTRHKAALLRASGSSVVERLDEVIARMVRVRMRVQRLAKAQNLLAHAARLSDAVAKGPQLGLATLDTFIDGLAGVALTSKRLA